MATRTWSGSVSGDYSVAGNWLEGSVPVNTDDVRIPYGSAAITAGLNQSAVTLASFIVEPGAPAIGTATTNLQIGVSTTFRFAGDGTAYIDIGSSGILVQVDATGTPATGARGLYIKGSAISVLAVNGGHVGLAWRSGETSSATTIRCANSGSSLWSGSGVTNTTYHAIDGNHIMHHGCTTLNHYNGTVITRGSGNITTVNCYGDAGTFYPQSSGTITTLNIYAGTVDTLMCGVARGITTVKLDPGGTLRTDPAYMTISNWSNPTSSIEYVTTRP
jgi:hypothetical protein